MMLRSWAALATLALLGWGSSALAQLSIPPQPPPAALWPRFVCEQGQCPPGIGVLLRFEPRREVGMCTATLVATDRIVTAAHCVSGTMHFFLPDEHGITLTRRGIVGVVHIESASRGADHAVLRLSSPIEGLTLSIARAELRPDSRLTIVRASPHTDRRVFVRSEPCFVMPQALSARRTESAIVRVAGCTILPGNSGAPMLDERGRVVAIVSSGLAPAGVEVVLAPWLNGPAPFVGTVSALACLPRGLARGPQPPLCARLDRSADLARISSDEAREASLDAQRLALAARLMRWERSRSPRAIDWTLERTITGDRTLAVPVPGCIDVSRLGRLDRYGRFRISTRVPVWEAVAFLGADVRMVPTTERVGSVYIRIRGRLDRDRSHADLSIRATGLGVPYRQRARVPVCR